MLLDTQAVPSGDRFEYWSHGIEEHYFAMRALPIGDDAFRARLTGSQIGPVSVRTIHSTSHAVARTSSMIAASDPESILFYLLRRGSARIEQHGRQCILSPGDMAVQDTTHPSAISTTTGFDLIVINFPRWFVGGDANWVTLRSATTLTAQSPFLNLTRGLLSNLANTSERRELSDIEADGVADILLTTLRTIAEHSESSTPGFDLLARLKRYALEHIQDPNLGPARLASEHFISTRYVHKLFAATDSGVSAWIREQRLHGAKGDLLASYETPVAVIAARWGYRDPASFSRAFRSFHGVSPSESRKRADRPR